MKAYDTYNQAQMDENKGEQVISSILVQQQLPPTSTSSVPQKVNNTILHGARSVLIQHR